MLLCIRVVVGALARRFGGDGGHTVDKTEEIAVSDSDTTRKNAIVNKINKSTIRRRRGRRRRLWWRRRLGCRSAVCV